MNWGEGVLGERGSIKVEGFSRFLEGGAYWREGEIGEGVFGENY